MNEQRERMSGAGEAGANFTDLLYSFSWKDPRKMSPKELFSDYLLHQDIVMDFRNLVAARRSLGI